VGFLDKFGVRFISALSEALGLAWVYIVIHCSFGSSDRLRRELIILWDQKFDYSFPASSVSGTWNIYFTALALLASKSFKHFSTPAGSPVTVSYE
jgi:hypothetical protein